MDPKERRMTAERCATLMSVAMANRLDEVWVSPHPELFYLYLFQYFPSIAKRFVQHLTFSILSSAFIIKIQIIKCTKKYFINNLPICFLTNLTFQLCYMQHIGRLVKKYTQINTCTYIMNHILKQ